MTLEEDRLDSVGVRDLPVDAVGLAVEADLHIVLEVELHHTHECAGESRSDLGPLVDEGLQVQSIELTSLLSKLAVGGEEIDDTLAVLTHASHSFLRSRSADITCRMKLQAV